jgi:hypothetical protein
MPWTAALDDAGGDHARGDGLDGEEHVAQVGGDAFVVVFGRHILPAMAVVPGRVVDQHRRRA